MDETVPTSATSSGERNPVWTNRKEAQLIKGYRCMRCLWDRQNPDYADERMRRLALDIIAVYLDLGLNGVPDVVGKIQELRDQYAKELEKESRRRPTRHLFYRWVHLERMEFLRSAVTADEREQAQVDVPLLEPEQGVPRVRPEVPDNEAANSTQTLEPNLSSYTGEQASMPVLVPYAVEPNLSSYAGEQTSMPVLVPYAVEREPKEALSVLHNECSAEGRGVVSPPAETRDLPGMRGNCPVDCPLGSLDSASFTRAQQSVPGRRRDTPDDEETGTAFLEPDLSSHAGESAGSPRQFFSVPAPMVPWEAGRIPDQRQPPEGLDPIVDGSQYEPNVPAAQLFPMETEHHVIQCGNQTPPHVDTVTGPCSSAEGPSASTEIGSPNPETGPRCSCAVLAVPEGRDPGGQQGTTRVKGGAVYICSYPGCGRRHTKRRHFEAHLRSHTGEKPYECDWANCGMKFARSDALSRHYRKHTGERRYPCERCGRAFYRNEHLLTHQKTHRGE
ncbi:uncharacterized protein LOC144116458 [Amblyomma americanum]